MDEELLHLFVCLGSNGRDVVDWYNRHLSRWVDKTSIKPNVDEISCVIHLWSAGSSDVYGWKFADRADNEEIWVDKLLVESPNQAFDDTLSHIKNVVDTAYDSWHQLVDRDLHQQLFHIELQATKLELWMPLDLEVNAISIIGLRSRNLEPDCNVLDTESLESDRSWQARDVSINSSVDIKS